MKWNDKDEVLSTELGAAVGVFRFHYYSSQFPIDPSTLSQYIFEPALKELSSDAASKLQAIITKIQQLPHRNTIADLTDDHALKRQQRRKDALVAKECFSQLFYSNKYVQRAVLKVVEQINSKPQLTTLTNFLLAQPYRLSYWKLASDELNYRRFFDINDLLAIKVEKKEVFEESLQLVAHWVKAGYVQALRLDHPDGLYDPARYFAQLQEFIEKYLPNSFVSTPSPSKPMYVLVEKILEPGEDLRKDWCVSGTVGYEYLNLVNGIFVDTEKEAAVRNIYQSFIQGTPAAQRNANFHTLLYNNKKLLLATSFETELHTLAQLLQQIARQDLHTVDFSEKQLKGTLAELIANFPVYRTYITHETREVCAEDISCISRAITEIRKSQFDPLVIDFTEGILLCKGEEKLDESQRYQVSFLFLFLSVA